MQPIRDEDHMGKIGLAASGRRVKPGLDASRSQWAASITWAGCDSQPMGDELYLGWMRPAANGRRALPGLDEERPEDPSILPVRRQISA
jgi:hypothetical protein